jgi:hypothetical protein
MLKSFCLDNLPVRIIEGVDFVEANTIDERTELNKKVLKELLIVSIFAVFCRKTQGKVCIKGTAIE